MAINVVLNKKETNWEGVKFKYKRPTVKVWEEFTNENIPILLDVENNIVQLKAKKDTEVGSFIEVHPPKGENQIIALGIEYDSQFKIWELKLKKPLKDRTDEPPTVNVTMGEDRTE